MFAVDVYEGATLDVGLTCTAIDLMDITFIDYHLCLATQITGITPAIDVAGNGNLRLSCHRTQEHH